MGMVEASHVRPAVHAAHADIAAAETKVKRFKTNYGALVSQVMQLAKHGRMGDKSKSIHDFVQTVRPAQTTVLQVVLAALVTIDSSLAKVAEHTRLVSGNVLSASTSLTALEGLGQVEGLRHAMKNAAGRALPPAMATLALVLAA